MDDAALDSPHDRLAWAREQAGFSDKADFARAVGVNSTTYRAYESGQNGYAKYAATFARKLGVTAEWLLDGGPTPSVRRIGKGLMPDQPPVVKSEEGSIALRHVDMQLSMGDGSNIDDYFEEGAFEFDAGLLRTISKAEPHRLVVAHGIGDSMSPTIHDDALVIFDTTKTALTTDSAIWAISIYGAGSIKRLERVSQSKVLVVSDNERIPNKEVPLADVRILGAYIPS